MVEVHVVHGLPGLRRRVVEAHERTVVAHVVEGLGSLAALLVVFGAAIVPLAAVQNIPVALVAFFVVGACGGGFLSLANSSVQTAADPRLQGRVAATYGVVFVGSRAVGGPLLGWMVDALGSRTALVAVGIGTAACALLSSLAIHRRST